MDIRNIKDLPLQYKETIEKSCLIFSLLNGLKFEPKKIDDFDVITVVSYTGMIKNNIIYVSENSHKIKEILSLKPHTNRFITLSDAVINIENDVIKNRWGVEYSMPKYGLMAKTMSHMDIIKFFNTECKPFLEESDIAYLDSLSKGGQGLSYDFISGYITCALKQKKPNMAEKYYLIGYEEDGRNFYYMEPEYSTRNNILTVKSQTKIFADKEEAEAFCKELNKTKKDNDKYLYVYERLSKYYDKRVD